jgi:uroporphyrinogen-III synthase
MDRQATPLILLTRPAEAAARFSNRLAAAHPNAEIVISPLQQIRFLDFARPDILSDALIFTSQNAVKAAAKAGLTGQAFCVGDNTAQAAMQAGFSARSAGGDAKDLIALIQARRPGSLWHLRGRISRGDVAAQLRQSGFEAHETIVYETEALPLSRQAQAILTGTRPVLLPLFSPNAAVLAGQAMAAATAPLTLLCLSPAVAAASASIPVVGRLTARRADADGMLEIVASVLNSGALS